MPHQSSAPSQPVPLATEFAPGERATAERLRELSECALSDPIIRVVFEAISGYALILNQHRQILAATEPLLKMLGLDESQSLIGQRPGEALQCVNARRGPNGCGTSRQCRHCGAVAAILAAQASDEPVDGFCSLTCCDGDKTAIAEYRLRVSPIVLGGEQVYVFVFQDVTAVRRRELIEKTFIHDLGNLLTGLLGWSEELSLESTGEAANQVVLLAQRLGENLEEQRLLLKCESGELTLNRELIDFDSLIASIHAWFGAHECAKDRSFVVESDAELGPLRTDAQLLLRVLGNLIKNALEATELGGKVTLRIHSSQSSITFEVHNSGYMIPEVAERIFRERFSTKGPARGLGMYAVQLFGEQYLGGQVRFETSEQQGTVFRFSLPHGAF